MRLVTVAAVYCALLFVFGRTVESLAGFLAAAVVAGWLAVRIVRAGSPD